MGIFGAMTTAITGLRAQSYALERISDNIANSQTTAYKRSDASFVDFVPDSSARQQALGVVNAFSRSTNTIQGDISNYDVSTYMAINGDGYFIIADQTDTIDGLPVFGSENLYTRRGDFTFDENGYLVNGAGYFLMGLPIDPVTGNPTGSSPTVVRVSNDFLPASETTQITYRANLANYPLTANSDPTVPGSEYLNAAHFSVDPRVGGAGYVQANEAATFIDSTIAGGAITAFDEAGASVNVQFRWGKVAGNAMAAAQTGAAIGNPLDLGAGIAGFDDVGGVNDLFRITVNGVDYDFTIGTDPGEVNTLDDLVNAINGTATLSGLTTASAVGGNQLRLTADDYTTSFAIGGDAAAVAGLGMTGGAVDPTTGGTDTWNLFYLSNTNAAGTTPSWV
ncbi:MAG: flagellar hook-basal body complex protein, partial [Hyphomicrobiales bacterium]